MTVAAPLLPFAEALEAEVHPMMRPAQADLRDEVLQAAQAAPPATLPDMAAATIAWTRRQFAGIAGLHEKAQAFTIRLLNATEDGERDAAILDFAERLGADRARLDRDAKALSRYFDADAVLERYRMRVGERERALAYGFDRAGELAARAIANGEVPLHAPLLREALAELLVEGRAWRGDSRIRQAAHKALRRVAEASQGRLAGFWIDIAVRDTRRVALNPEEDAWAQLDAMATLLSLSPVSLGSVLRRRLHPRADQGSPLARDNRLFVRRGLADLLARSSHRHAGHAEWLQRLANDADGAVRQALAFALPAMPADLAPGMFAKLRVDRDPQVRAALLAQPAAMIGAVGSGEFLGLLERMLARDSDEFVLRMAMEAATALAAWQLTAETDGLADTAARLRAALTGLRARSESVKLRRWAGAAREELWLIGDAEAREIAGEVRAVMSRLREGQSAAVKSLRDADPDLVGRVLAIVARHDFGFDYTPGKTPRLRRGDRFKRRWWRIFFEGRISATDKRQAWLHTIGRAYAGPILAPAAHMAELAPTKVPGEPLHLGSEAGWRNYLPLLDMAISAADRGVPLRIFTSEGITTVTPPRGLWRRLRAFFALSWNFGAIAPLRNQNGNDYIVALRNRGIEVSFEPHTDAGDAAPDPQVVRLFSLGGAVPALALFGQQAWDYFGTVYQNSLLQLGVFIAVASAYFLGRHILRGRAMRRQREGVALVLGGWGTRGKSGTERLKAGLVNALGHPLVSKTTGCEAMFLLGRSYGDLQEMFLFRPYDKATIWEQFDLVRTARGLKARVFLWECMGLTPSYVRVLQRDWMRDDISTITNTYPDHEDVQGPAGRNIPEVMTNFIPERGILLSTEEEMLPILREGADLAQTRLRPVGWKQAGLIHQSLLDRFPYAEHPFNIALVTAMADEMGLPPDFAVKEMSDRVVADLGVLKIYPRSTIQGRTLEFVMGMSANERFGAMGNWTRMGFAAHTLADDPGTYVSTVVNNRADRVPRSRVFARILVEDVSADRHVLIGSNIDGLLGFIEESWAEFAGKLSLADEDRTPLEVLEAEAVRQRVPLSAEQVAGRLAVMIKPCGERISLEAALAAAESGRLAQVLAEAGVDHAEDIAAHDAELRGQLKEYEALRAKVSAGGGAQHDGELREFLRRCFMAKLVPVREYYTPGEEIIRLVARHTPPGLVNRIMGMQNIKGTGLDWVYRWQAWEACHKACQQARDNDPGIRQRGLDLLGAFQEYGALSDAHVRATMAALKAETPGDGRLDAILARLDAQMAELDAASSGGEGSGGGSGGGKLGELVEAFLDSTDAVRRRRSADRIYRELIDEQISSQRAALELKKLTARQKGGWLGPSIASIGDALRAVTPWRRAK